MVPFVVYQEVTQKQNFVALVGRLFTLVGIGLLARALQRTPEWRRSGAAPVSLEGSPGSIGGHVGGTIELRLPYSADATFMLRLTSLYSTESPAWPPRATGPFSAARN